jgi:hypothetical protein
MSENTLRARITPTVPFTLHVENADGSTFDSGFQIAFDCNAFTAFEEVTGINILRDLAVVFDKPNVRVLTALLWAGILLNHPQYDSPEGLRNLRANIGLANIPAIKEACTRAFLAQLPKEQSERLKKEADERAQALAEGKSPNV